MEHFGANVKGYSAGNNVAIELTNPNHHQEASSDMSDQNENVANKTSSTTPDPTDPNWCAISASNEAKWWYSTFHNVTAMVGAGVLGLPFALSQLGWFPGVTMILVAWLLTFYSLWQLVEMHEMVPGTRFNRYFELGTHVYGPKWGYWLVMIQQLTVQVASTIVYCVTGGKSLKKFFDILLFKFFGHVRQTYFIVFFVVLQLLLSQTPNFNKLKAVSLLAALMSVCYSLVAFCASIAKGSEHHPSHYGVRSETTAGKTFDIFNALGTIAFAFAGHSVVLEIQATLPSTEKVPSKKPMWRGVVVAYTIVIVCYIAVAISGFWAFGNVVEDDVLVSLERPAWVIAIANLMVFFHVVGSFQVFAMPIFHTIETSLVEKWNCTPSKLLRIIARSIYVAVVGFVAVCIPFFGGLLGFFGGLAFTSTSFIIPCALWIKAKKSKPFSPHWIASMICITIGGIILVVAPIGGLRTIVVSAKTYRMFS